VDHAQDRASLPVLDGGSSSKPCFASASPTKAILLCGLFNAPHRRIVGLLPMSRAKGASACQTDDETISKSRAMVARTTRAFPRRNDPIQHYQLRRSLSIPRPLYSTNTALRLLGGVARAKSGVANCEKVVSGEPIALLVINIVNPLSRSTGRGADHQLRYRHGCPLPMGNVSTTAARVLGGPGDISALWSSGRGWRPPSLGAWRSFIAPRLPRPWVNPLPRCWWECGVKGPHQATQQVTALDT
jgi:hypothetical protein